jgi:hypothetical protein
MKHIAIAAILCITLQGCAYWGGYGYNREAEIIRQPALITVPETYTKAEVDAINAVAVCQSLARNQLQFSRCGIRR